jgi:hypothetical protein
LAGVLQYFADTERSLFFFLLPKSPAKSETILRGFAMKSKAGFSMDGVAASAAY